jgi:hypothetical protein
MGLAPTNSERKWAPHIRPAFKAEAGTIFFRNRGFFMFVLQPRLFAMRLTKLLSIACFAAPLSVQAGPAEDFFTQKVQPLLESTCLGCHHPEKAKGKLQMQTLEMLLKGGEGGAAIVAGKPDESLIYTRTNLPADHDDLMPPDGKGGPLPAADKEILKKWITDGAVWPKDVVLKPKEKPAKPGKETTTKVRSMAVYPDAVVLETKRDFHKLVAVATFADDVTEEVTARAEFTLADASIAKLEGANLTPLKDGQTTLTVRWHDQKVDVPVTVKAAAQDRPVSFDQDVMPVLMRANCNTGSCHGAARGQDGFRLSLFGYDPQDDHYRLTSELSGRRINFAVPEDSLLITKSVNSVPHTGGKKFEVGSAFYKTLVEWIGNGAPNDPPAIAKPVKVEIFPRQAVLEGVGKKLQFTVRATYSDGHDRDVTPLAVFRGNNDPTAAPDVNGLVTTQKRGEAFIMARFETFTVGSQVIVIPEELKYEKPSIQPKNYVDELVLAKLHKLRIVPSEVCDDATYLRRAYLDIIGQVPPESVFASFTADPSPDKRDKLVDELLNRKEFIEIWVMKWAELLQIRTNQTNQVSYKNSLLYFNWLKDQIANNVPINKIVRDILASSGGTFTTPATNYYQIERETLKVAENVAQVFMGMRLQCAQCHDHPFDRWTMNDYYGFASFFTQIGRKQAEDPRETVVFNSGGGETNNPVTKKPNAPKFLGGEAPKIEGRDRREVLAEWLASPQNPYFAKNLSNIVWSHFFGIGIIEPVDDVRVSNPASNPELLEELGKKFTEYNYDFKRLVRDICTSRTYGLSTKANETNSDDELNFSRSYIRRQRAEVMLDTLSQVTETPNKFQGLPIGARAVQIADGNVSTYFLKTFGRAERASVCSCEVKMSPSLSQALHLLNGDVTHVRIGQGGAVKKMLDAKLPHPEIITSLYVRCFSRKPTTAEMNPILETLAKEPNEQQQILEDVFWALLNSKEFMFNH